MKKTDAEATIRYLCHEWAKAVNFDPRSGQQPSFAKFKSWLKDKGYSDLLNFRSVAGANSDAERWFDQELKQTWRN